MKAVRMSHILNFTENHRYLVYRDFCIGPLESRMLNMVYQPMLGAFAVALYRVLAEQVPMEQVGYSSIEQQRGLFLTLGIEPSEKGRKFLIEQASCLEAVGLLQTSRLYIPEHDDYMYEYELQAPLSPTEFFRTQHLTLLLRDKLGKFALLSLREKLFSAEPEEWNTSHNKENISVPFYEIFELNTHVIDYELEQAIAETAISRMNEQPSQIENKLNYADIILRFPRESHNRTYVESLRFNHEGMATVNYVAHKYELAAPDLCRLLDEDGVFDSNGNLLLEVLQHKANVQFRQGKRRREEREVTYNKVVSLRAEQQEASATKAQEQIQEEVAVQMEYYVEVPPQFRSKCDIHQYNMMLRNEPYTRLLKTFFPGAVPDNLMDIFEKVDLNYRLPGEVINVLIHYLMNLLTQGGDQRINRNFVDAIASNMLLKQIDTYEKAVHYIREQSKVKNKQEQGKAGANKGRSKKGYTGRKENAKPYIPVVEHSDQGNELSEEDFVQMMKAAEQLEKAKKKS
ncbi:replication initiation and membrane attachment protein [Paenibacillus turicensis]|uniref:Replication initiation and membrane attachment protein n=1 Tax=Paenibacillus turicensis TaxID=160487 RepID=A0ABS4FSU7_9BACL|nr:replication initiation and membrane attachment protein [Paenibacillus turicensis]